MQRPASVIPMLSQKDLISPTATRRAVEQTTSCFYGSSGNDRFTAKQTYSNIKGDGGGNNSAVLNGSTGVDKFYALTPHSYIRADDNSYYNYVRGFNSVTANAVGIGDLAFMYGSDGNDVLNANSTSAAFTLNPTTGGQVVNTAAAFDNVYAYATGGGIDTANLTGTTVDDAFKGDADWGYLRSKGSSDYFNYVRYFDEVFADPGDSDVGNDDLDDLGVSYTLNSDPGNGNVW